MKRLLLVIVALVVLAVGALALLNFVFDMEKTKTHTVSGNVTEIVVMSGAGDVDLSPAGGRVEVRETQHYVFEQPELEQKLAGGVLTIESDCDTPVVKCYSDLEVTVPAGIKVTVEADSGDIDASEIDVRNAHVQSDSGDLRLDLAGRPLLAWAHTDSGDVKVVADNARAIDAQTDSGDVDVDAAGDVRKIRALTDSGDVDVRVPRGEYAVDADSDSGDVDVEAISRNERSRRAIEAKTDSGDVRLRAR